MRAPLGHLQLERINRFQPSDPTVKRETTRLPDLAQILFPGVHVHRQNRTLAGPL